MKSKIFVVPNIGADWASGASIVSRWSAAAGAFADRERRIVNR
jgi:hypothetical protein